MMSNSHKNQLTNDEVMIWIKSKWCEMYKKLRSQKVLTQELTMEYARKRKIYERMIWELGNPNDLPINK